MDADKIARRLAKGPTVPECDDLVRACGERRDEIRARIPQIADSPSTPPERLKAVRSGSAALEKLEDEIKSLWREMAYLDTLEGEIGTERERALDDAAVRAIPGARSELRGRIAAVRTILKGFDESLAELRVTVETLSEFERLPDKKFPLADPQLADLVALRNEIWEVRTAATLMVPDDKKQFPISWALYYDTRGAEKGGSYHARRPGPWLPDFVNEY